MKPEKSLACSSITPDMANLCKKIAQWRKTRRRGERMPERLWGEASLTLDASTKGSIIKRLRSIISNCPAEDPACCIFLRQNPIAFGKLCLSGNSKHGSIVNLELPVLKQEARFLAR